uniref:Uncharacterized protein n=1 Tax=Arundo donax TaxID=35708 RepID=A0A0A9AGQ9_ARUDO
MRSSSLLLMSTRCCTPWTTASFCSRSGSTSCMSFIWRLNSVVPIRMALACFS